MTRRTKGILAAAGLAVVVGGGTAIAATGGEDQAKPITGSALERARSVALRHVGGGRVTATEVGDEEGAYEIEVTRDDGSSVDVHLDAGFAVIDTSPDTPADHPDPHGN